MKDDLDDGILLRLPLQDEDLLLEEVRHLPLEHGQHHLQYDTSSPTAVLEAFRLDHPYLTKIDDEGSQSVEDLSLGLPLCPKLSDEGREGTYAVEAELGFEENETPICEDEADGTDVEGILDDDSLSLSSEVDLRLPQDDVTHLPCDGPACDESTIESQLVATLRKASPTKYNARKRSEVLMLVRKGKQQNLLPKLPKHQSRTGTLLMTTTRKKAKRGAYKLDHKSSWTITQKERLGDVSLSQTCWDNERQNKREPIKAFEPETLIVQEIELNAETAREILLEPGLLESTKPSAGA